VQNRREQDVLERPVSSLSGVGPRLGEKLARLGVLRVGDLLCLLPQRYEDRTELRPLGALRPGEKVLVEGTVELAEVVFRRRRSLLARVADTTGAVTLRFFHFTPAQQQRFARGARVRCFGEVRAGAVGLEMVHPEYRVIGPDEGAPETTLTPIYPSTEGLNQQRLPWRLPAGTLARPQHRRRLAARAPAGRRFRSPGGRASPVATAPRPRGARGATAQPQARGPRVGGRGGGRPARR
jgi:RecG-like helicase